MVFLPVIIMSLLEVLGLDGCKVHLPCYGWLTNFHSATMTYFHIHIWSLLRLPILITTKRCQIPTINTNTQNCMVFFFLLQVFSLSRSFTIRHGFTGISISRPLLSIFCSYWCSNFCASLLFTSISVSGESFDVINFISFLWKCLL